MKFQNAINEISEAIFEACYGSSSSLVLLEETSVLIEKFKEAAKNNESHEARRIFGRLLCLRQFQPKNILYVLSLTDFPVLFFGNVAYDDEPTLAFVVDDAWSMSDEIDAVKKLVKAIIKAEKFAPFFYILGTFNDTGNNINYVGKY